MTTPSTRPSLVRGFHLLALGTAMTALSLVASPAASAPVATAPSVTASSGTHQQELQFADEITRRLRRIGLNFNRARLQRPYDPEGELC